MHLPEQSSRDAPVEENMALQVRGWKIERLGWYGLLLIMAWHWPGCFPKGRSVMFRPVARRMRSRWNTSVLHAMARIRHSR
jgi:hypothetical protein